MSGIYGGVKCRFCGTENHVMARRCLECGMPFDDSSEQKKNVSSEPIDLASYRSRRKKKKAAPQATVKTGPGKYSITMVIIIVLVIALVLTQISNLLNALTP
ncbi:MAG: hypothetical protein ACOX4Q_01975 [Syntrophomonadales bacterium]